jgi:hypothetical protein
MKVSEGTSALQGVSLLLYSGLSSWAERFKGLNDGITVGAPGHVCRIFVKVLASRGTCPTFVATSDLFTFSKHSGTALLEDQMNSNKYL